MNDDIRRVADDLFHVHVHGGAIDPVRERLPANDVAAAYAVQDANTRRWVAEGRRIAGRKIGLTSLAVQKQLGVDQPDFGMLFADMAYADGEDVPWSRLHQPKCEAEVALVLEHDLDREGLTIADVIRATAFALPAIEIVGSRIANWNIRIVDTVADNASSGLYVLGNTPVALAGLDLRLAGMVMELQGEPVSVGVGAACLGHPLNAALWLARTMVRVGQPLKAGDTVLTGALGPMVVARPGDVIEARIEGLGSVRAAFGAVQEAR
ncbi:MAG: fumarylacetoacetate hydrolase family protein [Proteobacteria bacterium]|nr:fumarylacetoacetate hydrolase family protein [Pseudomonadota bacterium]